VTMAPSAAVARSEGIGKPGPAPAGARPPVTASSGWSAFARELKADVPQFVTTVHVAGIGLGEVSRSGAQADLFHDDVGAVAVAGDEQPGVIGAQLIAGAVPADTGVRDVLGDRAGDLEAERGPVERDTLAERAGWAVDDDVAGVGVPGGPGGGVDELGPDGPGGRRLPMMPPGYDPWPRPLQTGEAGRARVRIVATGTTCALGPAVGNDIGCARLTMVYAATCRFAGIAR
jgi:hypothetical protein